MFVIQEVLQGSGGSTQPVGVEVYCSRRPSEGPPQEHRSQRDHEREPSTQDFPVLQRPAEDPGDEALLLGDDVGRRMNVDHGDALLDLYEWGGPAPEEGHGEEQRQQKAETLHKCSVGRRRDKILRGAPSTQRRRGDRPLPGAGAGLVYVTDRLCRDGGRLAHQRTRQGSLEHG